MNETRKRTIEVAATEEQARILKSGDLREILRLEDRMRRERDTVILFWGPMGAHSHEIASRRAIDASDYDV